MRRQSLDSGLRKWAGIPGLKTLDAIRVENNAVIICYISQVIANVVPKFTNFRYYSNKGLYQKLRWTDNNMKII